MGAIKSLIFRQALDADLPAIIALYLDDEQGAHREHLSQPLPSRYLKAFADMKDRAGTQLVVAELAGELVCTFQIDILAGLSRGGARRLQIEAVRVARHHRGQGIGRAAMEWAIAHAQEHDCALVQLTTDKSRTAAHQFYLSLGFTASHEGMKLQLNRPTE